MSSSSYPVAINRTSVMIKPVGPRCNMRCKYCYYLPVHSIFGDQTIGRMSLAHLEAIFAGFIPQAPAEVMINWQGGEPTLAGLEFFRQAVAFQKRHARPGQVISNTLQTNGTLLDDDWCRFLHDEHFLIGISIDGRRRDFNQYRVDASGRGMFDRCRQGLELLKRYAVEFNVLCVLQKDNVKKPAQVWDGLLKTDCNWFQFIPAIEWVDDPRRPGAYTLASFSPDGPAYGAFLCWVFDEWFATCRDRISVRMFDSVLQALVNGQVGECTLAPACSGQLTVEHDGSVFGCDHFVQRPWQLATIGDGVDASWVERCQLDRLQTFSDRKSALAEECEQCRYKPLCWGGCPKHRGKTGDERSTSILCAGYRRFFEHALPRLEWLADFLRRGEQPPPPGFQPPPSGASAVGKQRPTVGPNDPCPCGSGRKYKKCCRHRQD